LPPMKRVSILSLVLAGCASTAELPNYPPKATYHSEKSRDAVADCLLNRLTDPNLRPEVHKEAGLTTIGFTGLGGLTRPGIYLFTIRDERGGSVIEARMMKGMTKTGLPTAETCF
jgi:hypothetical protein